MRNLVPAALFVPFSHFGLSSSALRAQLVGKLGERRFLILYQLVTLIAFAWLIASYRRAPTFVIWTVPDAVKVLALPVILLGFMLVVAGVTTPNPTIVGRQHLFADPDIVRGILRVSRNSFLWAVGLWAAAHLICIGDAAGVLAFRPQGPYRVCRSVLTYSCPGGPQVAARVVL